ncbi:MAG TPA: feruloyl-CoA synthase, partial [Alphaproteobacteria bacterium]|nr:feruloyl-CoA synthase [Alphaproteobacteria bacterium]
MAKPPCKPLHLAPAEIETRRLADGGLVLRSRQELLPYPRSIGELLCRWAAEAGERTFLAERAADGGWRRISYGEALSAVERIATRLLARGLDTERPI